MRIITVNLNGIRSAACKGFYEWLAQHGYHGCFSGLLIGLGDEMEIGYHAWVGVPFDSHGIRNVPSPVQVSSGSCQ